MNADTIYLLGALEPCWLWWLILSALSFILGAFTGVLALQQPQAPQRIRRRK